MRADENLIYSAAISFSLACVVNRHPPIGSFAAPFSPSSPAYDSVRLDFPMLLSTVCYAWLENSERASVYNAILNSSSSGVISPFQFCSVCMCMCVCVCVCVCVCAVDPSMISGVRGK